MALILRLIVMNEVNVLGERTNLWVHLYKICISWGKTYLFILKFMILILHTASELSDFFNSALYLFGLGLLQFCSLIFAPSLCSIAQILK